jgi:hypothetical protein
VGVSAESLKVLPWVNIANIWMFGMTKGIKNPRKDQRLHRGMSKGLLTVFISPVALFSSQHQKSSRVQGG